jgi:hypothetical protein
MRTIAALAAVLIASSAAYAEIGKTRRVGPWNVGAITEKKVFQHCIMARPETERSPGFGVVRGREYLALALFSKSGSSRLGRRTRSPCRRRGSAKSSRPRSRARRRW